MLVVTHWLPYFIDSYLGKQGDPLPPILFIFVVEAFSRSLKHLFRTNQIAPFSLPRGSPLVSHLSFADDLIVFLRATRASVSRLFTLLQHYEQASRQLLNKHKSSFVASKHCSRSHLRRLTILTGVKSGTWPFRYLGVHLFKGRRKKIYFQYILDAVHKKLAGWVGRFLSPGGRLILIKHVLSAIPLHVLAVLDPPKSVFAALEGLFSNFLWQN